MEFRFGTPSRATQNESAGADFRNFVDGNVSRHGYYGGMEPTLATYEGWLAEVKAALSSISMPFELWQAARPFDFTREFEAGAAG